MPEPSTMVAEQFSDAEQQKEAATLGMWTFIATEILLFGGLFTAYTIYRHFYFADFAAASKHTNVVTGTINSILLLTSSFTMALAVRAAGCGERKLLSRNLLLTVFLGAAFLSVKWFEYQKDMFEHLVPGPSFDPALPRQSQIFFWLYWVMTGLHTLHVCIGVALLSIMAAMARRGRFSSDYHTPLEMCGLYWHFVDIVWIFLYPLLYLVRSYP